MRLEPPRPARVRAEWPTRFAPVKQPIRRKVSDTVRVADTPTKPDTSDNGFLSGVLIGSALSGGIGEAKAAEPSFEPGGGAFGGAGASSSWDNSSSSSDSGSSSTERDSADRGSSGASDGRSTGVSSSY